MRHIKEPLELNVFLIWSTRLTWGIDKLIETICLDASWPDVGVVSDIINDIRWYRNYRHCQEEGLPLGACSNGPVPWGHIEACLKIFNAVLCDYTYSIRCPLNEYYLGISSVSALLFFLHF